MLEPLGVVALRVVGAVLGAALPERPIGIAAGAAFLGFALWTIRDDDDEGDDEGFRKLLAEVDEIVGASEPSVSR